ncbi:MAG: glutamate--cysteine ligase [Gammaproteobacteria bacterium]|nr:glutamate--cysteine ligase [Gammaproteobacteria bacterium]
MQNVEQRVQRFAASKLTPLLKGSMIGLEKESLRVNSDGKLARTPHPRAIGAALTHPYITTDYSEALLEFITPPFHQASEALHFLRDLQQFVYKRLDNELLWATSMPCVVAGEEGIPIAQYGSSNAGMMKTIYRRGLGHRYGRVMQVIAGVHFNYSYSDAFWQALHQHEDDQRPLQDAISARYFDLIRNLLRYGWVIPYLFGASPAVCKSFLGGRDSSLESFDEHTYYEPYATSLRMGDIGYQNNKENETGIKANYDSLTAYVDSLSCAINTPAPAYQAIGVKVDGEYRQLNANILQIENEYYSTVRPKQILDGIEKPSLALKRRGVRYIELRSLDVNAFDPLGISECQMHFIEALMLYCLLADSPPISTLERVEIDQNEMTVAHRGREPGLCLQRRGESVSLRDWAQQLCEAMLPVCRLLDSNHEGQSYQQALARQLRVIENPQLTPSARMLAEMRRSGEGFYDFARRKSLEHQWYFSELPIQPEQEQMLQEMTERSLQRQLEIEAGDRQDFDSFLAAYVAQGPD